MGMTHEFDHLPGSARSVWREQAERSSVGVRYWRRRLRQTLEELEHVEATNRLLEREVALLEAQVDVLRMALTAPRGTVPRAREDD